MGAKKKSLPECFPDAAFIVQARFWTPKRNIIDVEGPFEHDHGLVALLLLAHPSELTRKQKQLVKELTETLKTKKKAPESTR